MTLTYREMRIDDLPAVAAVRFSTLENAITPERLESQYGITLETMARDMQTHVRGWLCEIAGEAVGFAMADRANGEIQVVAVRPEHEGKGIGKTVLARAQTWLFAQGHEVVWLCSNPDSTIRAYGFYRRLGWRASGQRKGDDEILTLTEKDARPIL